MAKQKTHEEYVRDVADKDADIIVLGDCWHGNLDKYLPEEQCHSFNNKTTRELNDEWLERKNLLEQMGYNVVYIWESEFREMKKWQA